MRLISFSMTLAAFLDGSKTVTRRLGWKALKAGDRLAAVEKSQGLKKGEKVKRLGEIEVVSVHQVPLWPMAEDDVAREGFPGKTAEWFVDHFAKAMRIDRNAWVTRIEFRKVGKEFRVVGKAAAP